MVTEKQELRLIVRIASRDLDGRKPIYHAIRKIKGISHRYGLTAAKLFEKETGIKYNQMLGNIPEDLDKKLEDIISNPVNYGIPEWMFNRRRDFSKNKIAHVIAGDLEFATLQDIKRMNETKSYKGLRHSWGLTLRGQRTKTSGRKRGTSVGVAKTDAKKTAAPAAAK
ncbi:MAG: 30S ribosomal protein S13 [Candidatus Diapherotrites archaeon]|nr:30S ribosomal protein S13 [Candidatus Diapherotrites archaeon]